MLLTAESAGNDTLAKKPRNCRTGELMSGDHENEDLHLPILVGALRSTLRKLEEREDLSPDDPALREIKSSILRTIARRETDSGEGSAA
jgi:hypothetical protein